MTQVQLSLAPAGLKFHCTSKSPRCVMRLPADCPFHYRRPSRQYETACQLVSEASYARLFRQRKRKTAIKEQCVDKRERVKSTRVKLTSGRRHNSAAESQRGARRPPERHRSRGFNQRDATGFSRVFTAAERARLVKRWPRSNILRHSCTDCGTRRQRGKTRRSQMRQRRVPFLTE